MEYPRFLTVTSRNSSFESPWAFLRSTKFSLHVQFFLVLALMCHSSNSDFNVIIPEICAGGTETPINVTWIRDMVHLGLRDEQLALTVLGPEGMFLNKSFIIFSHSCFL